MWTYNSYIELIKEGLEKDVGFFIRHAEKIRFSNVSLTSKTEDKRPAIYLTDVRNSLFTTTTLESLGIKDSNIIS